MYRTKLGYFSSEVGQFNITTDNLNINRIFYSLDSIPEGNNYFERINDLELKKRFICVLKN